MWPVRAKGLCSLLMAGRAYRLPSFLFLRSRAGQKLSRATEKRLRTEVKSYAHFQQTGYSSRSGMYPVQAEVVLKALRIGNALVATVVGSP